MLSRRLAVLSVVCASCVWTASPVVSFAQPVTPEAPPAADEPEDAPDSSSEEGESDVDASADAPEDVAVAPDVAPEAEPPAAAVLDEPIESSPAEDLDDEAEDPAIGVTFEPGEGVLISTADHRFEMNIRARAMLMATTEVPEEALQMDGSYQRADPGVDFSVRRARVSFQGRIFDPHIRYKIQLALAPADLQENLVGLTRSPLLDAYFDFQFLREAFFRVGQFVLQYNRSRVVSSSSMQLVDRSLANAEFNLDRDVGLDIRSLDFAGLGWLRYYAGVFTNEGRDSLFPPDLGLLYVVRLEVLPLGLYNDYSEGDLDRTTTPRLSIGVSYAFSDRAHLNRITLGAIPGDGGAFSYHNAEADLAFSYAGFWLTSEVMWRDGWHAPGPDMGTGNNTVRRGLGWYLQVGYLLPMADLEIAARYGFTTPITSSSFGMGSGVAERSELGGGLAYYFHRHAYKIQVDAFHLWGDADFSDGAAFGHGETRIRLQLQLTI